MDSPDDRPAEQPARKPRPARGLAQRLDRPLSRRELLREVAYTSGLAALIGVGGYVAYSREPVRARDEAHRILPDFRVDPVTTLPQLAVVRGDDVERMARAALARLGGIERFVRKGDRVLLKPNIGWDRQPEQAANTGPELVGAMVTLCREAGAARVWVTDGSLNDPYRCFARSGIAAAVERAGGTVRYPVQAEFIRTDMQGQVLRYWPVNPLLHQVDRVINLPIVKHHSLSGCTLAMKNWYGVIGGQRNRLHQEIHTSIVDLAAAVRPTLTVMDATRVLKRNGPTGGNLEDVTHERTLIAGLDEVAIDSFSTQFLDLRPEQLPFLAMAEARGLGKVAWRTVHWVEDQVG